MPQCHVCREQIPGPAPVCETCAGLFPNLRLTGTPLPDPEPDPIVEAARAIGEPYMTITGPLAIPHNAQEGDVLVWRNNQPEWARPEVTRGGRIVFHAPTPDLPNVELPPEKPLRSAWERILADDEEPE